MAAAQNYAGAPRRSTGKLSAANPNRDGTGTIATVFTSGASGSRIDAINIQATAATTAGMVRLFEVNGANTNLLAEIPVDVVTPSATQQAFARQLTTANSLLLPIILPNGWNLAASTHNAEPFNVSASGGDF